MRPDAVRHGHIWNNLPLLLKGLMLLMIPVPALLVAAMVLSAGWKEQRQALASLDKLVTARQTLQDISSILLVPGNSVQDYRALNGMTKELSAVVSDRDRLREINAVVQQKLESLAALQGINAPDHALLDRDRGASESLQSSISALALEYDQLLTDQSTLARQAGATLVTQVARSAFVFLLGELLAALLFLNVISGQVRTLKVNSRRLAAGEPLQPFFTDNWEINQIGRDLMAASVALNQHERELEAGRAAIAHAGVARLPSAEDVEDLNADLLRQRNRDLAASLTHSREALEAKGRYLADLSRELRTLLGSILGSSEMLYDGKLGPVNEQQKSCLSDVLTGSKGLLQLADGVAGALRADRAPAPPAPGEVDLERLAKEVRYALAAEARKKGVRIEVAVDPGLRDIKADRETLRQSLHRHLADAIQFTSPDASLDVRIRLDNGTTLRVEVRPAAISMPPGEIMRLFPEFRLDAPPSDTDPKPHITEGNAFYAILAEIARPAVSTLRTASMATQSPAKNESTLIN